MVSTKRRPTMVSYSADGSTWRGGAFKQQALLVRNSSMA